MNRTSLNRALKFYDRELYAQESKAGRLDIYRKSQFGMSLPYFLFSLTDTWKPEGNPVEYGLDVVMNRIKAHDLWRDPEFVTRWIQEEEKRSEGRDRSRKNSIESFLYDFRSQFHKATSDINTSNMKKTYRKGL